MSEHMTPGISRTMRAWPERPGPAGPGAGAMSGHMTPGISRTMRAWPERPGPQGQERVR